MVKNMSAMRETQVRSLGWEDPLEKGMATHSCEIPEREEPGRLQFKGLAESYTTERPVLPLSFFLHSTIS